MATAKDTKTKKADSKPQTTNRKGTVIYLYPEQLEIRKGFNVRFDMGDITQLSKSIKQNGIIDPLRGYKSAELTDDGWPKYIITEGHRRFMAADRIKGEMDEPDFIPFIAEPEDITDVQRVVNMLATGENKLILNMLETARGVKRLHDSGMKQSEIAKVISKSAMYVSDCMLLMEKATDKMIRQIETGQVAASSVVEMLKINAPEKVEKALDKAVVKADEKAGGKGQGKVKASQIREESGAAMTVKGKKADQAKAEKRGEKKPDATLEKLQNLKTAMKAQEGDHNKVAFGLLNALIKYCDGRAQATELIPLFITDADATGSDAEEEDEKPVVKKADKKKVVAPAKDKKKKAVAGKKKSARPADDEDEDDEIVLEELSEEDDDEDIE